MTYEYVDAGLVRLSTYAGRTTGDDWPDLDGDHPAAAASIRSWLRAAWADTAFAAAVELASPGLAARVRALTAADDSDLAAVRRVARAVVKYHLRARGRATPFGLFAGVAPLRVGVAASARLGNAHQLTARVDSQWLTAVVRHLEGDSELRSQLPVTINDSAFARDGRLVLTAPRPPASGTGSGAEVSVALSAPVRTVTECAADPIEMTDLAARLRERFPHAPESVVRALLDGLVEQGFLLTALHPPMTATRPLRHVIDLADCADPAAASGVATAVQELTFIEVLLHGDGLDGDGVTGDRTRARMRTLAAVDRPVGADVLVDAEVTVPDVVTAEAAAAADALVTLSPFPGGAPGWVDYHRRFLDRYGIGALVPVTELLHPDRGLGHPAGFRGSRWSLPSRGRPGRRDELLLGMAHDAAWARQDEAVLTERDLVDLRAADDEDSPLVGRGGRVAVPHTELRAELHAKSRDSVDAGAFRLVVLGASRAAGTLSGRFLDLLDPDDRARMATVFAQLPTMTSGATRVQVSGPPMAPRAGNIDRGPQILPEHITVATHGEAGQARIPLADLAVSADTAGLYLVARSQRKVVEPVLFSAIELVAAAHPTVRFLAEIATARATACVGFTWSSAARSLRRLPRLRFGRSVLAPARWTLTAADLPAATLTRTEVRRAWDAWRERCEVPDRVLLGQDDRRLPLDLTVSAHRHVLLDTLRRRNRITVTEAPAPDAFGWIDGRVHELVLPLAAATRLRHPSRPRSTATSRGELGLGELHLPGVGDWLDARLPLHPDRQNTVLAEHLPALLDALTTELGGGPEWWFVRLIEPEPHLRVRIRLPRPAGFAPAAARVGDWVAQMGRLGLAGDLRFDTYRPEVGRYGSGPAMAAAEVTFAADSAAAVAQLRLPGPDAGPAVTAASMLDMVTAFAGHERGLRWLLDHAPRTAPTPPSREERARAIALIDPAGLSITPGGDLVLALWARRRAALAAYRAALADGGVADPDVVLPDLLHLHHVRVAGPSLHGERVCLHLARSCALSVLARSTRARATA